LLYGHSIAKELPDFKLASSNVKEKPRDEEAMDVAQDQDQELPDQPELWSAVAYFTNADYQAKKFVFLLFINCTLFLPLFRLLVSDLISDRLVESPRMKWAFEAAYQGILLRGASPYMYLRLTFSVSHSCEVY
jgi:DNA mismatch repair protein MLH1